MVYRNLIRGCLAVFVCLVVLPAIVSADTFDPEILIDFGGLSPSIVTINAAQPGATGTIPCPTGFTGQCFDFLNDSGAVVISLTFQTMVNAGLREQIANVDGPGGVFSCQQGTGNEYFLGCMVQYDDSTGALSYTFQGVSTEFPDGDEIAPGPFCPGENCDTEAGEREGIPIGGHFLIGLGGYVPGASVVGNNETNVLLYGTPDDPNKLPTFQNTFTTPEPSMIPILAGGAILIAVFARRFRRRESQSSS